MAERYSTEQVRQILVRAMERGQQESFSRSQLEEMAADLSIPTDALTWAEQDCQKLPVSVRSGLIRNPKRQKFYWHLRAYTAVNTFLLVLNFILCGTITWAIYPLLGWGMGLLLPAGAAQEKITQNMLRLDENLSTKPASYSHGPLPLVEIFVADCA